MDARRGESNEAAPDEQHDCLYQLQNL